MLSVLLLSTVFAHSPNVPLPTNGTILLDGKQTSVQWDDGDTFFIPATRTKARLSGFNTLEGYGAVHRVGNNENEKELFTIAQSATDLATGTIWACTTQPGDGGYGRSRVDCPDLRKAMLTKGLAHAFAIGGPAPSEDLEAQRVGIDNRSGIWKDGAPIGLVTSLHSLDEKEGATATYNRILDPKTGEASKRPHSETYAECTWVCPEGQGSCMLYVPYKKRYGSQKASCLLDSP